VGLEDDQASRLALVEYIEWGSRLAAQPTYRRVMVC
jgi:hypothetical protein